MIKIFNEMEAALNAARPGLMVELVRAGVISSKLSFYREVFLFYDKEIQTKVEPPQASFNTAEQFDIAESTVYRIIRAMKGE